MLYARKINRRINSGIYIGPTQGLSSPKNNRRACLCTNTDTYSRECCNGDLIAQGIGSIQGTTTLPPSTTTTTAAPTTTSTSTTSTSTTSTSTSTSTSTTSTSTSTTTLPPTSTTTSTSTSTSTTTVAPLPIVTGSLSLWTSLANFSTGSSTWIDRSGNGNTALISGSTLALSGSLGVAFNGTNNLLTYPAPLNGGDPTTDWTVQFYGTWNVTSNNLDFFTHEDYQNGWDIALTPDGRTVVRANTSPDADFNYTIPDATLAVVTIVFDKTNSELKLYANTTLINTISETIANWNVTAVPLTFGFNTNTDATYFAGTVRELTLYTKVLTLGEITTNYNAFIAEP